MAILGLLTIEAAGASCAEARQDEVRAHDTSTDDADDAGDASFQGSPLGSPDCGTDGLTCDGVEWYPVETPLDPRFSLASVWGSGENDVWAVGSGGSVLHWDGSTWTYSSAGNGESLFAIWGSGPNDVWIASSPAVIFHAPGFTNGTAQWSAMTPIQAKRVRCGGLPCAPLARAVWGTSPGDVWVGGDPSGASPNAQAAGWRGTVTDGGVVWTTMFKVEDSIYGMWGSGPEDIWIVGSTASNIRTSFSAHTNGAPDGGLPVWTVVDTQTFSILYALWGSGTGDVWAVGDSGTIRHFTSGAERWSTVESPTTELLRGIWGVGSADVWAVGAHGTILHYDGRSWVPSTASFPPGNKPNLYGVWGSSSSDVWAVGEGIVLHHSRPKSNTR